MEVRRLCEQWQQDDGLPNPGGTVPADQAAPGARERPQWPQGDPREFVLSLIEEVLEQAEDEAAEEEATQEKCGEDA